MPITEQYVQSLAEIYRDVLSAFPSFDTTRKVEPIALFVIAMEAMR